MTASPRSSSPASAVATLLLRGLIALGVRDLVLCPGSRSQALALAAAQLERDGELTLHVRLDERGAGFFALGLAVESGRPVPVVMTSGTAVAELHPAVLEAAHSGVPLIVLSADRPAELRGIGSNQTTVQPGMFASAVVGEWDVAAPDAQTDVPARVSGLLGQLAAALDARPGPLHLNLQFREPLSGPVPAELELVTGEELLAGTGAVAETAAAAGPGSDAAAPASTIDPLVLRPEPGTVVIAGARAGERAEQLSRELGAPLLAEVSSGARFGPNAVPAYRELLDEPGFGDEIRRVVVLGQPTLNRQVPALLRREGVETIVVRAPGRDAYDPAAVDGRPARVVDDVVVEDEHPEGTRAWVGRWVFASRALLEQRAEDVGAVDPPAAIDSTDYRERAAFARSQLERMRRPVTREELAGAVWSATWPHDRLVLAASRLIRVADDTVPGKRLRVHANRGLAGIDGTVATALGVATESQREGRSASGTTRLLIGDLALLHDVGSLALTPGEARPRIQVIVGNDGGGTIFDGLEVAGSADPTLFDRVQLTPQQVDLSALAAAYGWEFRRIANRGELDEAFSASAAPTLIEVVLGR
ncbi:2-succinyl-5-enolpyruvyl-6-hydroxy-3-cyclohexene-1-carboxylic-acid synthase [Schumannella sp. 10F1B-5-1]|uniref:2-succinyl-5-enolpyruvyl-6-hydroxy-3- cyclohexene-1-carboxylic-acid synthase n=1 Tax=Schumannella sp. 10F1B-5-1 TaxID=2590780 RepID=UPI001131A2EF|nr:2-succinyl-5-enolpyruvyl-6-hydroxy-3-cyclohexene-1-carboxylic-acid synthase [Schumannella sp. 10F1B-5-1]TPW71538.1 2-succinyl-5-enolpyruvyl-6-hydroxy-3-cyclohexene-1-carboxylic-acid synthase [Schumannella sp. 10F1B-5-1]